MIWKFFSKRLLLKNRILDNTWPIVYNFCSVKISRKEVNTMDDQMLFILIIFVLGFGSWAWCSDSILNGWRRKDKSQNKSRKRKWSIPLTKIWLFINNRVYTKSWLVFYYYFKFKHFLLIKLSFLLIFVYNCFCNLR